MRRPDRADLLFIVAAAVAAVVLLRLGAGLTFFSDEWAFIESRSFVDPTTWFQPHNEHWATIPVLVYRALVETVGLGSYMPYLAVLVALHLTVAALVYSLVRRSSGSVAGLAVGVVVLLFGSGFENLYWAFQIGFVGALAAGIAAIVVFDAYPLTTKRAVVGACLLVVSLATQGGPGLICCVAVGVELLLDPSRRRAVPWLAVPAAIYGVWYVIVGRVGVEAHEGLFSLGGLSDIPPMIVAGFSSASGAVTGVGSTVGALVAVMAVVGFGVWSVRRGRFEIAPRTVGCLAAIATMYGLIALARSFVGPDVANYTRYTYVSGILLAVGVAAQIGQPRVDTPTMRRAWLLAGGLVFTLGLAWNVRLLMAGRELFEERAERTRALVTVALERPLPATTDPERTLVLVPSPASLARIVTDYGSPLDDWLVPWAVVPVRESVLAEARRILVEGAEIPLPSGTEQIP